MAKLARRRVPRIVATLLVTIFLLPCVGTASGESSKASTTPDRGRSGDAPRPTEATREPSALRLAHLSRGINLGSLFTADADPFRYEAGITPEELAMLRNAGFTFCRLPIHPGLLFDVQNPSRLKPAVRYVDRAVDLILDAGMSVVIDPIHTPSHRPFFQRKLVANPEFVTKVEEFWGAIASRYADRDADRVFFEIMNEPHASKFAGVTEAWWPPVQEKLARAIRAAAPRNTIIATGEEGGRIDGLLRLAPLPDSNVVYSFHFYQPTTFTLQGAPWAGPVVSHLRDVPYPSSPNAVTPNVAAASSWPARWVLERYGGERWDIHEIRREISRAARWSERYRVPLLAAEFGASRSNAPPADRYRWIHDVRTVLEEFHMGWAMWAYNARFGLVDYEYPSVFSGVAIDSQCLTALGLEQVEPERLTSPIDRFDREQSSALTMPVSWLKRLWTRDESTGEARLLTVSGAPSGNPTVAWVAYRGAKDWGLRPGVTIPVTQGQSYVVVSSAKVVGSGSCRLDVIAFDDHGGASQRSLAGTHVAEKMKWRKLEVHVTVPQGVSRIVPRWSGHGPATIELDSIEVSRTAESRPKAPPGRPSS